MKPFDLNRVIEQRRSFFSIELLLPFFLLFAQYRIGPISIGSGLLMVVALQVFSHESGNVRYPMKFWPYYVFLVYIVACDIFRAMLGPDPMQPEINRMCEYVVMFFLVFVACSQPFDEDLLYKYWKIAGVVFTVGILFHVVQIYVFKHGISPISIIPGYVLRLEDSMARFRPCSFFAEPAAFTNSMLPLLFLSLKRNDFRWAVFCTISILLSTSTVGVILSVVLWFASLIIERGSFKKKIAMLVIFLPIIWIFLNMEVFSVTQSKFFKVAEGESTFGSRVLVGLELIRNMSFFDLPFGTRYSNLGHYVTDNLDSLSECRTLLRYWGYQRLFLNAFCRFIFQYGIVGLFLFLFPLIRYLNKKNYEAKAFIIMILLAIFGQSIVLNSYFFMLIMFSIIYDNKSKMSGYEVVK